MKDVHARYYELINEVINKVDGESRHETALRIIKESYTKNQGVATKVVKEQVKL